MTGFLFDMALCSALILLGWRVLHSSDHFQAVVLFITFGLILALAWVRLEAPDIAIAEAAVGASLAGVMLLDALRVMKSAGKEQEQESRWINVARLPSFHLFFSFAAVAVLSVVLISAVMEFSGRQGGLTDLVHAELEGAGTKHPVTAVLLNFRGYDTWIELGVLLLAVLGVLSIRQCSDLHSLAPPPAGTIVFENLVRGIMPLVLLVSGYLLWRGSFAPGGAFQAGVVLGAGGILLWMAGYRSLIMLHDAAWRMLLILGFLAFLTLGSYSLLHTGVFLAYNRQYAGLQIFLLESGATLSIGTTMAGLVLALQPLKKDPSRTNWDES